MVEHPYRAPARRAATTRRKPNARAIALAAFWVACVVRGLLMLLDHSLAGPVTGLAIALAIIIPIIALNARVLAGPPET